MPIAATVTRLAPIAVALISVACQGAQAEAPEQPIDFRHPVHIEQDQLDCQYCHYSVARSAQAGIPAVGTCMGCHRFIKGSTQEFQQEIERLTGFWADSTAVPWVRVHRVPEFVQFAHKPHVRAGVDCAECHGDVGAMDRVQRVAPLTMGWCLECHIESEAPQDCAVCHY